MLLNGHEAKTHELAIFTEFFGFDTPEDLDHFCGELEGSLLEFDTLTWGVGEKEAEVDVHDVPCDVNHDVAIVTIFDLKDVADEGVGGK